MMSQLVNLWMHQSNLLNDGIDGINGIGSEGCDKPQHFIDESQWWINGIGRHQANQLPKGGMMLIYKEGVGGE